MATSTSNRPTTVDHTTPASEKSVYFDAPIMHIFSKKKESSDAANVEGGNLGNAAGFVAPSPKRDSKIHSTTSLKDLQPPETADEDTRSASAAVPGHLPAPAPSFPEPTPAPASAPTFAPMATSSLLHAERGEHEEVAPLPAPAPQQSSSRFIEDPAMASTTQGHKRPGSLRSTDFATLSPSMGSPITNVKRSGSKLHKNPRREGSVSTATATDPDSGYDSPSPRKRLSSLRKDDKDIIAPVPVVWTEGAHREPEAEEDGPHERIRGQEYIPRSRSAMSQSTARAAGADVRRSQSMRSYHTTGSFRRDHDDDEGSMHTTPSGRRTPGRRRSFTSGSFANGAGTIGPNARADEEETELFRARSVHAEAGLTKKDRSRLGKAEIKEGKRMAKVIKEEAKAEKKALEQSVRELAELQKIQKYAVKEEAKTNASYAQALRVFHKEELAFLAARAKYERAQADLQCYEDARDGARDHAREATEMLQDKNREIEWLRAQKHADDRERELKLRQLAGKSL